MKPGDLNENIDDGADIEGVDEPRASLEGRAAEKTGGGRRKLLLFVLLLLLGGMGGAYYYLGLSETEVASVPSSSAPESVTVDATAGTAPAAPLGTDVTAADTAVSSAPSETVTVPDASGTEAGAPAPEAPLTMPEAPITASETAAPVIVSEPVPDVTPSAQPDMTMTSPSPAPSVVQEGVSSINDDIAPPETAPQAAARPSQEPVPAAAIPTAAQPDLPMPAEQQALIPETAPAPPSDQKLAAPTDAEKALIENAAKIDQLGQPKIPEDASGTVQGKATPADVKAAAAAVAEQAIVRPLPETYIVVKKSHDANATDARITAGRTALARSDNQASLDIFSDLEKDYPRDARVLMGRALALQKAGQNDEALAAYQNVLEREPKNLEALTNMLGLLKQQDPALAIDKLQELRKIYPYSADITAQLGVALASRGDLAQGMKYLNMADALAPGRVDVLYNRAVLYDKMGNAVQAADLYRQILIMAANGSPIEGLPIESIRQRLSTLR